MADDYGLLDNYPQPAVQVCQDCGADLYWIDCEDCHGEGWIGHDCGEDVCCCLDPDDDHACETCDERGGYWQCERCGAEYDD